MSNDEFGNYSLPDESLRTEGNITGTVDGPGTPPAPSDPSLQNMMNEDPDVAELFKSGSSDRYEDISNVRTRRIIQSREVQIVESSKGGPIAKWGFVFGMASTIMGLVFMGGFLLDAFLGTGGLFSSFGCWLGLLGAGFSVIGLILSIIGLVLGAGLNKGKGIFGLVFSIFYWVMLGIYFLSAVFLIAAYM